MKYLTKEWETIIDACENIAKKPSADKGQFDALLKIIEKQCSTAIAETDKASYGLDKKMDLNDLIGLPIRKIDLKKDACLYFDDLTLRLTNCDIIEKENADYGKCFISAIELYREKNLYCLHLLLRGNKLYYLTLRAENISIF